MEVEREPAGHDKLIKKNKLTDEIENIFPFYGAKLKKKM